MRALVSLALCATVALTIAACGGGGGDEGKIVEVIETATTTTDPSGCTELQTRRFNEQNYQQRGGAAIKACEEQAEAGENQAEGAKVSNVSINDERATAEVEFEGGALDSQTIEVALVQDEGAWKLDHVEGFAQYNGKALGQAFRKRFDKNPEGLSTKQSTCIVEKVAGSSRQEAEALFFSGSSEPIIKLAESCA
ncbi:MAG: hypothetical protein JST08_09065 [Actinobacteria bacterium]|nr:hypothetical protein [Actinomycetota bacterium]